MNEIIAHLITASVFFAIGCFACRIRMVRNKSQDWNEKRVYFSQWNPFNKPRRHIFTKHELKVPSQRKNNRPQDFK